MSCDTTETVATFERDGKTYEIDHLGILHQSQQGEFAVYCDGKMMSAFTWDYAELPADDVLVRLAREALAIDDAAEATGS